MAEEKKSVIIYADLIHTVKKMPKEKAGELFMIILEYVNDINPIIEDVLLDVAFEPIKQQMKRDLKKWEAIKLKRSDAGKASAEAKKALKEQNSTKSTSVESVKQTSTKSTVTVNVTVNVINKDIAINNLISYFNYNAPHFNKERSKILDFVNHFQTDESLLFFIKQFNCYVEFKKLTGYPIAFKNFLGNQSEKWNDGRWSENWEHLLDDYLKSIPKAIKPSDSRRVDN